MISVIITAFKEPKTIGKAVESLKKSSKEMREKSEIIVIAPDEETLKAGKKAGAGILRDSGEGKSVALNLAVSKAKGDILILTDGDVHVSENAISALSEKMKDEKIGAVTGKPVSINSRKNKFGFWAYLLTKTADERRKKALRDGKRFFCSGYLFAIRKKLFPKLQENLLSEDGYVSHRVYEQGFKISYADKAEVYVKYPDNFSDWIKQKKRSAGGYNQIRKMTGVEIRSFRKESSGGFGLLNYVSNLKELFWLFDLFLSRIYLWILIYRDINLKKKSHKEIWKRVESTK
jgi:cellulose synthase/poly-beta-1,6-N-acetylglucosamine synthase-like glycosyltransferase